MEARLATLETRMGELFELQRNSDERQNTVANTLSALVMALEDMRTEARHHRQGDPSPSSVMGRPPPPRTPNTPPNEETQSNRGDDNFMDQVRSQGRAVTLPPFTGDDPIGWVTRADLYFELNSTREEFKVPLAHVCMEGATVHWFSHLRAAVPSLTWDDFKRQLIVRYGGRQHLNPFEELATVRQSGTVDEFIAEFEVLVSLVPSISEEMYNGFFLGGLREEIRRRVKTHRPGDRMRLLELSRDVEWELTGEGALPYSTALLGKKMPNSMSSMAMRGPGVSTGPQYSHQFQQRTSGPMGTRAGPQGGRGPQDRPYYNLTYKEYQKRRAERLCFKCGLPFSAQHVCSDPNLRLMLLLEDDDLIHELETDPVDVVNDVEAICHSLELNTMGSGWVTKCTKMRFDGEIRDTSAIFLIDTGASHNFISEAVVDLLGLERNNAVGFSVKVGDGRRVHSFGKCTSVPFNLGGVIFYCDAFIFPVRGVDMILGETWLNVIGEAFMSWAKGQMIFTYNHQQITLQNNHLLGGDAGSLGYRTLFEVDGLLWNIDIHCTWPDQFQPTAQGCDLNNLMMAHDTVFRDLQGLPPARATDHAITLLPGSQPVNVRPYRYAHIQKEEIDRQVSCMLESDLKSGYHQIRVREHDIHKTAFRTHEGHYEFIVMPFGLMNAPATFQATMNQIFRPYLRKSVLVFFDDILVYSNTWLDHLCHLEEVLSILQTHRLVANRKKCHFGTTSIDYLGHTISGLGVEMDSSKIQCVLDWPIPSTVKAVRGFLGLTGYYRKFIREYGIIARPLTQLTKKDAFCWNDSAQTAFDTLKRCITEAPLLQLPDFSKPFVVECDASGSGIGAVLMQDHRPIAYFSKALSSRALSKSTYDKELMGLVLAIQHWRPYLLGREFSVYTDHKTLKYFLEQRIATPDQQYWLAKLMGYKFQVIYKSGKSNKAADALSRRFEYAELHTIGSFSSWLDMTTLKNEIAKDSKLQHIILAVRADQHSRPGFTYSDGILLHHGRLVIPSSSSLIPELLSEFHSSPIGGHSGFLRTYRRLAQNVFWHGMRKQILAFVRSCDVCQRHKYLACKPAGLLQPLDIPTLIWEDISMDFITGLPKSQGFDVLLVVVDRLSKYSHFILLKHPFTAKHIAEVFSKEIMRLHGVPRSIVSDRDPIFMSNFWKEFFKLMGTKLRMSSSYHPQSDGQTEVINRTLETYLRCFASDHPKRWSLWVPWAEYWYNTTFQVSSGRSPFEIVYGRKPPTLLRHVSAEIAVETVALALEDRDEAIRQLRSHLERAKDHMKKYSDAHRRDLSFAIGEPVYIKLRPHRQQSVSRRICPKLSARFYGPFTVVERIGSVAYKVDLPPEARIHPVFHVSQLRRSHGTAPVQTSLPPGLADDQSTALVPSQILLSRDLTRSGRPIHQWLIRWEGQSPEDATWEDASAIRAQFPNVRLEDKSSLDGGGIVRPNITLGHSTQAPDVLRVYTRGPRGIVSQT